jgi:aminopeptidase-like protein
VCHPSLCNDNLSGISVSAFLAQRLARMPARRYSYRFLFIPGTIGSITWLATNREKVGRIRHGLVVTCVGDSGPFTYKKSRRGDAEIDHAVQDVLKHSGHPFTVQDFFPYGYDERQYCSPGFNLSVGCLMRSSHGAFPEYHTSADNLQFVRPEYLEESLARYVEVVEVLEGNRTYVNTNPYCEPQLGKRGLYDATGGKRMNEKDFRMSLLWVLNLSDGQRSLLEIAEKAGIAFAQIREAADALAKAGLLKEHCASRA